MTDSSSSSEHSPDPPSPELPRVRLVPGGGVPVFNCHVYLSPSDSSGNVVARVANLDDFSIEGPGERGALRNIVEKFKKLAIESQQSGQPIAWLVEPHPKRAEESQRFVPVHL